MVGKKRWIDWRRRIDLEVTQLLAQTPQDSAFGLPNAIGADAKILGNRIGWLALNRRSPKSLPRRFFEVVFDQPQSTMQ
jgi:hypothetical protein